MFLIRLLRWLRGWVRFEAEGGFPERMLNLCARQKLQLWDTLRQGIALNACCFARDYRKLRPLAKKAGLRMHVRERHGVPFFLRPYRARVGLALGLAVYVLLLQLLSQRIWVIDVRGTEKVSEQQVLEVLEPLGVRLGGNFDELDLDSIQLTALEKLPDISWLAVNLEGSVAHVELEERIPTPELVEPNRPSNIKAARDGRITVMEVYGGQAIAQKGDAVVKGTLLVSGVVESTAGPILKRAQAKILAETTHDLEVRVPLKETKLLPGNRRIRRPTFQLFNLFIPLYTDGAIEGDYQQDVHRHALTANGVALPLALENRVYTLLEPTVITRTEKQAAALAAERLRDREQVELGKTEIRQAQRSGQLVDGVYLYRGQYACLEDIGMEEQILLQ